MAFADKLGSKYTAVKDQVKIKVIKIQAGEVEFELKVRVPLKQELESINETIVAVDELKVEELYNKLSAPVKKSIDEGGKEFLEQINKDKDFIIVRDNDIIVDGNSIRNVATMSIMWQLKVEEYFHLLISETGEPINETFEQIEQEFPDEVIKKIVDEIEKAIKPTYESVKKN